MTALSDLTPIVPSGGGAGGGGGVPDDGSVTTTKIVDQAVTSAKIADGAIVNADVSASAAIDTMKLSPNPLARANHTGTQTAATISDLAASLVPFAPTGFLTATDVQAAIAEVSSASGGGGIDPGVLIDNSILKADIAGAPSPLTVPPSTFVGRGATGGISALTPTQAKTALAIAAGDVSGLGALATKNTVGSADIADGSIVAADLSATANIAMSQLATNPLARANHTGTQLAATISDFTSAVQAVPGVGGGVSPNLWDAQSLVVAVIDNTPVALAVPASTFVGRASSGDIAALTGTQAKTMLAIGATDVSGLGALATKNTVTAADITPDPFARANHTGTQTASTISNFDTQVRTNRLDQMAAPTAALSVGNQLLTNVATPVNPTDGVNKVYTDNVAAGLDFKASAKAASTATVTLASPGAAIDGVTLAAGNRVLLKNQTTSAENGVYDWNGAATAMTRSADADTSAEVTSGMFVFVEQGTTNGGKAYVLSTPDPITLGTTALTFAQFAGGGTNVVGTANRITVTGPQVDIASNYVGQSSITTIGYQALKVSNGTTAAVGLNAAITSSGPQGVFVGTEADSTAGASADGGIVAIGYQSKGGGGAATAVGFQVTTNGALTTGVGYKANAASALATAIGASTNVAGQNATAVGAQAVANFANGLALGYNAAANAAGVVAIGTDSSGAGAGSATANDFILGTGNHTVRVPGQLYVGGVRVTGGASLTGLTTSTATFLGVNAGNGTLTGAGNVFLGAGAGKLVTTTPNCVFIGANAGANATDTLGNTLIGANAGSFLGTSGGSGQYDNNTLIGFSVGGRQYDNTMVGAFAGTASTTGAGNTFVGRSAGATSTLAGQSVCIGNGADLVAGSLNYGTAVGALARARADAATAVGAGANASGVASTTVGYNSVGAANAVAVGFGANAPSLYAIAVGTNAIASATYGGAIGRNTYNEGSGSWSIGTDSAGNGANTTVNNEIKLGTALHTINIPGGLTVAGSPVTGGGGVADGSITSAKIADGAIMNVDINTSAAIALSKLATNPLARANHTGTQLAATISDFDTQVRTSPLNLMAVPTGAVNFNGQAITGAAIVAAGTTPAQSGPLRIPWAQSLTCRNSNNTADIALIAGGGNNGIAIDPNGIGTLMYGPLSFMGTTGSISFNGTGGGLIGYGNQKLGFWGRTPRLVDTGWSAGAYTTTRTVSASSDLATCANVLSTLVAILYSYGILG